MVFGTCTSLIQRVLYKIFMKNAQILIIRGSEELEIAHMVFNLIYSL